MKLTFTEDDKVIGSVELVSGSLNGPSACVRIVKSRMQRNSMSVEQAMASLDNWSNGYLKAKLEKTNA